jgi:hypothetical protein
MKRRKATFRFFKTTISFRGKWLLNRRIFCGAWHCFIGVCLFIFHFFRFDFIFLQTPNCLSLCLLLTLFVVVMSETSAETVLVEQFVALAKVAGGLFIFVLISKSFFLFIQRVGAACKDVIERSCAAPDLFIFGELLDVNNVKSMETASPMHWNLINLFAYGNCDVYYANLDQFPPLKPAMLNKLRQLTIVDMYAQSNDGLSYLFLQSVIVS